MKKTNILVIDDIQSNIYSVSAIIENNFEANIYPALSASKGFEVLLTNNIDLIISDIQMPEIDGIEFASYIKNIDEYKDIPLILNSAIFKNNDIKNKIEELNIFKFLPKPIDEEELKLAIQNCEFENIKAC